MRSIAIDNSRNSRNLELSKTRNLETDATATRAELEEKLHRRAMHKFEREYADHQLEFHTLAAAHFYAIILQVCFALFASALSWFRILPCQAVIWSILRAVVVPLASLRLLLMHHSLVVS